MLFDAIFSKTPSSVLKEALKLLATKAVEKSSPLNTEQINLALHQIKVDHINLDSNKGNNNKTKNKLDEIIQNNENESTNCNTINDNDDIHKNEDNNNNNEKVEENNKKCDEDMETRAKHASETFRTQILTELIRMHISGLGNINNDKVDKNNDIEPIPIRQSVLETELDTPIPIVIEQAQKLSVPELEASNNTLKPYIRQLTLLKASLTSQFKELEDSRAFIALGLNKNASDAAIKKAYHSKAVKLHPDKGGDKEKFQKLNDLYQEVLRARRADNAAHEASMLSQLDPQTKEAAEKARAILDDMENILREVKLAADRCGRLGQRSIRLQSLFDTAAAVKFPKGVRKIDKLLSKRSDCIDYTLDNDEKFKKKSSLDVKCCEATLALPPLEKICEAMQSLASAAMNLPSCGSRYGLSAAKNTSFMKLVESSMGAGITALKNISNIIVIDEQVLGTVERFHELKEKAAELPEIHDLLLNLISTGFRSRTLQICAVAEKAVAAAMTAAELCGVSGEIIKQADEEIREEAKRAAAAKEEENHYSEEDKVELAEVRKKQREEMCKQNTEEFEKEQEDKQKDDSIESLKDQIKCLQVQLRVQHVQALHSLNGEAREIQKKLQQELIDVARATSIDHADKNAQKSRHKNCDHNDFKMSLLSLIADFIDCSCNSLRSDIQNMGSESSLIDANPILRKHLGWMISLVGNQVVEEIVEESIVDNDNDKSVVVEDKNIDEVITHDDIDLNIKLDEDSTINDDINAEVDLSNLDNNDNNDINNNDTNNENQVNSSDDTKEKKVKNFKSIRLALLPDFRSKVLWISALLDESNVSSIITNELSARLNHILDGIHCDEIVDEFCLEIMEAITIASQDINDKEIL